VDAGGTATAPTARLAPTALNRNRLRCRDRPGRTGLTGTLH